MELNLVTLKALAEQATPGPWRLTNDDGDNHVRDSTGQSLMCDMHYYPWTPGVDDMKYIAAASPDVVLALVAEAEKRVADRAALQRVQDQLKQDAADRVGPQFTRYAAQKLLTLLRQEGLIE